MVPPGKRSAGIWVHLFDYELLPSKRALDTLLLAENATGRRLWADVICPAMGRGWAWLNSDEPSTNVLELQWAAAASGAISEYRKLGKLIQHSEASERSWTSRPEHQKSLTTRKW